MSTLTLRQGSLLVGGGDAGVEWVVAESRASEHVMTAERHLVMQLKEGVLIAVVEAAFHGAKAYRVADAAVAALRAAGDEPLATMIERCHRELEGTRGAVAALAWFEPMGVLTWLTVGNVNAVLMRRRFGRFQPHASAIAQGGLLGWKLPVLRASSVELHSDDLLLVATGGVSMDFAHGMPAQVDLEAMTRRLVTDKQVQGDDSMVLAARYGGISA